MPNGFFGIVVNSRLQTLKSKQLVRLSFGDDSRTKIYLSMEKMWAKVCVGVKSIFKVVASKPKYLVNTDDKKSQKCANPCLKKRRGCKLCH